MMPMWSTPTFISETLKVKVANSLYVSLLLRRLVSMIHFNCNDTDYSGNTKAVKLV